MNTQKLVLASLLLILICNFVSANSCIVDTNNNGVLDVNDSDSGADAADSDNNLRCGKDESINPKPLRNQTVALGSKAISSKNESTVIGAESTDSSDINTDQASTVLGSYVNAPAPGSTVIGGRSTIEYLKSNSAKNSTVLGYFTEFDQYNNLPRIDVFGQNTVTLGAEGRVYGYDNQDEIERNSVGIGHGTWTGNLSNIAIGVSTESTGSHRFVSSNQGSIAIGENTYTGSDQINIGKKNHPDLNGNKIGSHFYPLSVQLINKNSKSQLKIDELHEYLNSNVRRLLDLICSPCTPAFRFANEELGQTWYFRMLQAGSFSMDDPATLGKEAVFQKGGNLVLKGNLTHGSSKDIKKNIRLVNADEIVKKITALPLYKWAYKHDMSHIQHIGPMAEDFYDVFELGENRNGISDIDTTGVSLTIIKALINKQQSRETMLKTISQNLAQTNYQLTEAETKIEKMENQLAQLESDLAQLQ